MIIYKEVIMKRDDLSPEKQFVLLCSVEAEDEPKIRELLDRSLDWSQVIFQMLTHRTINMLYYNSRKWKFYDNLVVEIRRLLETQWHATNERNLCYRQKLTEVWQEFNKANLVVPILKGNLLANFVYPALEARTFNDLDFLMQLSDVKGVIKALEALGYLQGHFHAEKGIVVEATKKEKMLHQMASHEIQEFQKTNANKFAPLIQIDVNYEILWKGNCPYRVDTSDLIKRAVPIEIDGVTGYMLDYIDNIIQLCCHLFKEATLMMWITSISDLKIYKFADIYLYIKKWGQQINWDLFLQRIEAYNLQKVIFYNFYYVELMFGQIVPPHVMERLHPGNLSYLDEYAIENQSPSRWEFDFFTRLFDINRVLSVDKNQMEGMNRFLDAKIKADGVCNDRNIRM